MGRLDTEAPWLVQVRETGSPGHNFRRSLGIVRYNRAAEEEKQGCHIWHPNWVVELNVLMGILISPRFVPFWTNLTQFGCQIPGLASSGQGENCSLDRPQLAFNMAAGIM